MPSRECYLAGMTKRMKVSDILTCARCGHKMIVHGYEVGAVASTATPDRVHRVDRQSESRGTFMCACGHYTINQPAQ